MLTRRSLKHPRAFLSSLKKSPKYREMLRRAARKFHLESLEARQMFAVDPVLVAADGGVAFNSVAPFTVRNESPRELVFTFPGVPGIDQTTLANGIQLIAGNKDGVGVGTDSTIVPAYLAIGNDPTQVVMRFATPLTDDAYQIQFIGATLRDTDGLPFNNGTSFPVNFSLNLAPQVQAIVPQPIVRDATTGALNQLRNQIDVYFNNDDLDVARAEDENFYRLLVTRGTVDPSDDAPTGTEIIPTSAIYDASKDKVVLTFSADLETFAPPVPSVADPAVAFRLRIGTNEIRRPNVYGLSGGGSTTDWLANDPGSTFDAASNLRNVLARGLNSPQTLESFINGTADSTASTNVLTSGTSVIIGQSIDPQFYNLIWPGGNDDPGHRDIHTGNHPGGLGVIPDVQGVRTVLTANDILENHLGLKFAETPLAPPVAAADQVNGITTYYYNFRSELGYVPDTSTGTIPSQPTFNVITERQKQRAREALETIGQYAGVNFVETEQQGFIIATGDMRAILTTIQTGAGGVSELAGTVDLNNDGFAETAAAIVDNGEDWSANGADLYGNAYYIAAMHAISEVIGLGHSYDLSGLTVQGYDPALNAGLPGAEPVFPGDNDIVHMQHVYRPEGKDIDMYRFEIPTVVGVPGGGGGIFTAEVFAERLANSSQLDSALSIYRINPQTQQPELYARNDDYFSKDSFIELQLEPGIYYVGVSASGNIEYDPNVVDSGMGGTTQGAYQLKLDFRKVAAQSLNDNTGIALDGDSDGKPGGVNNYWFRAAAPVTSLGDLQSTTRTARTIYVDRAGARPLTTVAGQPAPIVDTTPRDGRDDSGAYANGGLGDGSLASPFLSIDEALAASRPYDIIRVVGNALATTRDTRDTNLADNLAYQIGFDRLGAPLADGAVLDVPKDRTLMFDAGAVVQLRRAQISVGSENQGATADRSGGALQVLGTPWQNVYFTSFNRAPTGQTQIGLIENFSADLAEAGNWGGLAFRSDIDQADGRFDFERRGIFMNYISNADIRYGGGQVIVNSTPRTVNPIHLTDARPTIINNRITLNADSAMSANPDSFEESNFSSPQFGSTFNTSFNVDYKRVGPEIHGNILTGNTVNAITIRSRTQSGTLNVGALEEMHVAGRFDDTDIVHVIQENLVMHSAPGGALVHSSLSSPGTALSVAAPAAGTGGFPAGIQGQLEYKLTYVDEFGNEGLASSTIRITAGSITPANSFVRLTNLPNITSALLAQGFVGRRLYRRIGGTGDFVLVEQIPASASGTYIDRNLPLPASALRLKVSAVNDTLSPRILANANLALPAVSTAAVASGGQYTGGQNVVYGLTYVDTEGRDTPMSRLPAVATVGPNGSVNLANLPATYGSYMGLRVYRSIGGGQFDLIGLVDAGATTFVDTGAPVATAQVVPSTVNITVAQAAIVPALGGFSNGQRVNYRFTYAGTGGETASSALAVPGGELGGYVIVGNNRQLTLGNLPSIDLKSFSTLQIYRSINYGRFELVAVLQPNTVTGTTGNILVPFVDTNPANPAPTYLTDATLSPPATARARPHGSLVIDPSMVMKSDGARIDVGLGAGIIAEGVKGRSIIMTSLYDQRYGAGGTFATSSAANTIGTPGDWAGIYLAPDSKGSFNEVVFAYGGGESRIEGTFTGINVMEIQQAKVRVANSRFEFNDGGVIGDQSPPDRLGRGPNDDALIFVRGAQPVVINNTIVSNQGAFISINANGMNSANLVDFGRQTGLVQELPPGTPLSRISYPVSRLTDTQTAVTDTDNNGPLIRLNKLDQNEINGIRVRGGVLTTETVWDDTDIAHVLFDSILIPDFHTYGGLRLESGARESLVVKAASDPNNGTTAGFIADGRPLEIEDRIGGTLQVMGQPGFPVVITSFTDDTISAGLTPSGKPQNNTNGDALAPPLPTIGEVANGLRIDNDVAPNVNGYFSYGVNAAGAYATASGSAATAQGLVAAYNNVDLLFEHFPMVYAGTTVIDLAANVLVPPFLNGPDEVISSGVFAGTNGPVQWRSTTRIGNGSTRLTTTFEFNAVAPATLGALRVIDYLDQNVGGANNDILYLFGSPGQSDFRLLTLDNADRVGFAQGGVYAPGAGLQNARYIGFMADKAPDLRTALMAGSLNTFGVSANATGGAQNIDVVDLPQTADRALGNVYGTNDVTSAMAWDISPTATTSTVTTYIELFPRSPVTAGRPGEWAGIRIDEYANDRNVETVPEREPISSNGAQNSQPRKAQFLGSLAGADKGGDENLRLGFVVQGAISTPSDVDVYSFKAKSETEVWFDIDRTAQSLDSVIELVDEFGNVLARSDNSADESLGADSLIGEGAYRMQKSAPYEGLDLYSTNVRDAGMRIKLPGPPGIESTYFVRVRSVPKIKTDLDTPQPPSVNEALVTKGVSYGAYELQVRLREKDEKGGTTIRYAKIANATTGIDVNGLPTHSPLGGEQRDEEPNNVGNLLGAQELGNLLSSDRGAISVGGTINAVGETDWYTFTLDYRNIDGTLPVESEIPSLASLVNTVFDLDYADGLARPNMQMFVFDDQLNLILSNFDSNVADDRGNALAGGALSDLGRGSVGFNDSYIGNISLPASTPFGATFGLPAQRYYVAVTGIGTTPTVLDQFSNRLSANPQLRMEPIDSVHRIVEDHLNEGTFAGPRQFWATGKPEVPEPVRYLPYILAGLVPPDRGTSDLPDQEILFDQVNGNDSRIPWHLGDTTLYILRDSGLEQTTVDTFNPFTGTRMSVVGTQGFDIRDLDFNGVNLTGLTRDVEIGPLNDAGSGHLIQIATTNGAPTDLGGDGIITYEPEFQTSGAPIVANGGTLGYGVHYNAMAYGSAGILYGVGQRGEAYLAANVNPLVESQRNLVYQLNTANAAALVDIGAVRDDGAWTDAIEAGEIFTEFKFTAAEATNSYRTNPNLPTPAVGYFTNRNFATNPNVPDPATGNDSLIPQLAATFNIRDGEQITVTDGDTTHVLEFDAGFDFTQTILTQSDNTIRDGYYFILDRDDVISTRAGGTGTPINEVIYQFESGPVLVVNPAINSFNIPDGATFTINVGGGSRIFEFDRDGNTLTGTIPVTLAPPPQTPPVPPPVLSSAAIATLIQDAVNQASDPLTFPVTAYVNGASSRISFFPTNPAFNVTVGGFSDALRYLDPISGGGTNSMPFLKLYAEGGNGAAPVLQAYPQPNVPGAPGDLDGRTFVIRHNFTYTDVHTFEFQLPGTPAPGAGRIAVPINYGDTGSQVAAAMQTAIQTALNLNFGVTANQYNNDDRVVINGLDVVFAPGTSPINNLMATQAAGGLAPGGGILIAAKEAYPIDPDVDLRTTNQRIADAIMNTVNTNPGSPFIVGAEGATDTGRVNFPPITNLPGRVPVRGIDADGNPTWAAALDDSGNPASFGRPGVSTGAIAIPFLAFESSNLPSTGAREAIDPISGAPIIVAGAISPLSIAARVEQAIDTFISPSTGIVASSTGPFVTLNRGRIVLPPNPNTPFSSQGPITTSPTSNPPGGDITGMVYLPELTVPGVADYFLAVSDRGGLYEVRVDWLLNTNLPVFTAAGNFNPGKRLQVTTTYIEDSELDLTGIRFQGLTRGPAGVEINPTTGIGRYTNTFFGVAEDALVPPANSIVAPGGFVETEQNNSMPQFGGQGQTDESFVTHLIPNVLSGTRSVYQSVLTNGVIGNGINSGTIGDYDFYHFQANVGETITIDVQGAGANSGFSLVDSYITVYNAQGTPVASDDNSGAGFDASARFTVNVNAAGDYYVVVRSGGAGSRDLTDPFFGGSFLAPGVPNGAATNFTGTYGLTITRLVDSGSALHAFNYTPTTSVYGGMQPIFANGNTSMPLVDRLGNPIQDAIGLRFGELQRNLWTMTPFNSLTNQHRQYDPGHGLNLAEHESEGPNADSDGHSSFYFGRSGVGSTYNFNNGAAGSIVSNEFSLEGYSAIDQPVLYFSYFSDHETNSLYDSMRLFISGIGDNNADRDSDGIADTNSGNWVPLAFDEGQFGLTPIHTGGAAIGGFRQVRVPLDAFAGQQGLRLRFDFSTAGDMDLGRTDTTGEELRTVSGEFIADGQFISVGGQVYELNSGVTATFSTGRATPDGETITLTDPFGVTTTFEFDKDGVTTNTPVIITDDMSAQQVAQALLDQISTTGGVIVGPGFAAVENNGSITLSNPSGVTYLGANPINRNTVNSVLGNQPAGLAGDYDFYSLQAAGGETITATIRAAGSGLGTLGDSWVTLYNSAGAIVAFDDDSGPGLDSLLTYTVPNGASGSYYLVVRSFGDTDLTDPFDSTTGGPNNFTGTYSLELSRTGSPLLSATSFLGTGTTVSDAVLTFHGMSGALSGAVPGSVNAIAAQSTVAGTATTVTLGQGGITANGLSTNPGFYVGQTLQIVSGPLAGEQRVITGYNGAGLFTVGTAFSAIPAVGTVFNISSSVTVLTGAVGLNDPAAIELPYRRDDSRVTVATTVRNALEQALYEQQLVVNIGSAYFDGQTFDLTDVPRVVTGVPTPAATTTLFEFEAGEIIDFPDDGADNTGIDFVVDGDTFEVTWTVPIIGATTRRFEFDSDGIVGTNGVVPNVRIPFIVGDSDTIVSNSIALALVTAFPGMQTRVVSGSRVQLDTDTNGTTFANFADPLGVGKYTVIGTVGVTPGSEPVYYTESNGFSVSNMAARISASINTATIVGAGNLPLTASTSAIAPNRVILNSALDYILNPDIPPTLSMQTGTVANVKQYEDLVRLISPGSDVQRGIDFGQRGPFGWDNFLPGDQADNAGMASNLRGQNNNFEGVYLDDFVIGLAERGEMITGVTTPVTTTTTVPPLDPSVINQVRLGDYQLEIRRGVAYDFTELDITTFTPDSNDRFTTQQTLLARDGATLVDGQTFTLSDGNRQLTFEFNDVNQIPPVGIDVVTPGNQQIDFNSTMKDYEVAVAIRDAINTVDVQQILTVNAWMGDGVQPGLATTTNRVNLSGSATFVATGVPVLEPNEAIASALQITGPGVAFDGLRFFANGTIGDSDDATTSQNDAGRRSRDVDYFGLDLVAGQRINVDIDASILGSTLDSYLRIFDENGVLQNVTINGVSYTAENDGPTVPMLLPGGGFSTVNFAAPGEVLGGTSVIGNGLATRPDTDSALTFTAPAGFAGTRRFYIAVSGAGNNRYNPVTGGGAIPGSTGTYLLEVTSPNAANANSAGITSAIDVLSFDEEYGDRNLPRDQGQLIIQGNEIYNSATFGIDIDAGTRVAGDGNAAHQGGVRNLSQANAAGLITGVVVMNNVIYGNGQGAISFSGDPVGDAPVPYGRIVNNTLFGQGGNLFPPAAPTADVGIRVTERAGPTMLNNIIVNFGTAVAVDATSRTNTVIGGIVTQGNNTLSNPANIGFGDFPINLSTARNATTGALVDPLFRNPTGANFYLDSLSRAIDSSVDSLLDRALMVTIKAPLGLGESPILSPDRDSRGQVRADDPAVQTPQGFGLNPFKDRGAIDRVDKDGPGSNLINPQDNDSLGIDRDSALTVVSTDTTAIIRNFTISLIDQTNPNGEPDGSDLDDFTVTSNQVIVTRRIDATTESVLVAGVDYFFSYDSTSNLIVLTPVGNVWTRGTYRIYLNNGILDQAGNALVENHTTSLPNPATAGDTINHWYDIFLGTAVDYGDAPATYPVLAGNNGANHFITPGVYIGNAPTADFDGQPAASASLDSNDDGVTFGNLLPGVTLGSRVTVIAPTNGLKLSAWFDVDGTVGWNNSTERVLTNYVLTAGSNVIDFTIPNGIRGTTYARFRVSTQDIPSPAGGTGATGSQLDGEVEDYRVTITGPAFQNPDTIIVNVPGTGPTNVGNLDVNDNGFITAFDALIVINYLNLYGATALPIVVPPPGLAQVLAPPPFLDTNGNGGLNSFDALLVINHLNLVPLQPPAAPESVSVGGGAAPEATDDVLGEAHDAEEYAALQYSLIPDTMFASSSILLEEVQIATPAGMTSASPVEDMLDDRAMEMILLAMAERGELDADEFAADAWQDEVSVPAGPLTEGDWADLLDDLAMEQAAQA